MGNPETNGSSGKSLLSSNSSQITMKLLLIGALIIGLLIPKYMVVDLVGERSNYSQQVNAEVARNWGGHQNLAGPFLVIPYVETVTEKVDGKILTTVEKRQLLVNPQLYESLNLTTREMTGLLKDFRANPKKFLRIKLGLF